MTWKLTARPTRHRGSSIRARDIQLVVFSHDFKNRSRQFSGKEAVQYLKRVVLN